MYRRVGGGLRVVLSPFGHHQIDPGIFGRERERRVTDMGPFRPGDGREPIHVKREYIHSVYIYIQETLSKLQGKEGRGGGVGDEKKREEEEEEEEAPTPDRTLAPRRPRARRLRPITGGSLLNVPWPNTSTNNTQKMDHGPPLIPLSL